MQQLTKMYRRLERRIVDRDSRFLGRFPFEAYTGAVERWPGSLPYHYECPEIRAIDARIIAEQGPDLLEIYHQLALVRLLSMAQEKVASSAMPSAIRAAYVECFALICSDIETTRGSTGRYLMTNPPWTPFWTYLGLAALKIIPAGVRIMIPEFVTVRDSPLRKHALQICPGQEKAWIYRAHVHPMPKRVPGMLNHESYRRSLRLSAAMLEYREDFVAVLGKSWYLDPLLPDVSPRFSYMPGLLKEAGAILERLGSSDITVQQATQASPARKKLYEEGKYQPTAYSVIYPRDSLIEWARQSEA